MLAPINGSRSKFSASFYRYDVHEWLLCLNRRGQECKSIDILAVVGLRPVLRTCEVCNACLQYVVLQSRRIIIRFLLNLCCYEFSVADRMWSEFYVIMSFPIRFHITSDVVTSEQLRSFCNITTVCLLFTLCCNAFLTFVTRCVIFMAIQSRDFRHQDVMT